MKTIKILGVLTALAVVGAAPLVAQRGGRPMAGPRGAGPGDRPGMMTGAERALQMRERLELTQDQVSQLNQVRVQSLEQRQRQMAEIMEVQSRFHAGEATRDAVRQVLESQRETRQQAMEAEREQVTALLTEAQRETFGEVRPRGPREGRFDRGARRGRGFRNWR